jgi:hypothetical protein
MKKDLFSIRSLFLGMLIAGVAAVPSEAVAATSTTTVDTSACAPGLLGQPFLAWKDTNEYELMPGEAVDGFAGDGWTLSGGASIVTTKLADGSTGEVLNLPSGSKAVSPTICVQANYPLARTMVRDVKGSEGVFVDVSYAGTSTWETPKNTGQVHSTAGTAWALSGSMNLQPINMTGWQLLKLTLVPGGTTSDFQVYNLYVDPKMAR